VSYLGNNLANGLLGQAYGLADYKLQLEKQKAETEKRETEMIDRIAHRIVEIIEGKFKMAANLKKSVKTKTDANTGRTKLERVHTYDASKTRQIAKKKKAKDDTGRVVSKAKARAAR